MQIFLACNGYCLEFTPTGPRYLEDRLVVRGRFIAMSNEKALIYILKNELEEKADKLKHMKLNVNSVKTIYIVSIDWREVAEKNS